MRTKLAPKKLRQQFLTKVVTMLLNLGAKPGDFDFALQTKVGLLRIYPTENHVEGLGTVFSRFDNPKAARELVGCHPSGRWNFYCFGSVEEALEELAFQLAKVLA